MSSEAKDEKTIGLVEGFGRFHCDGVLGLIYKLQIE